MLLHQRFVPGLAIASYIVGDEQSGEAIAIDVTRDVVDFIDFAVAHDLHITHILETHVHADFVSGARELKARLTDEPVIHASAMGGADWLAAYADEEVREGHEIRIGAVRLRALHTPGHTPEHVSWALFDESRSRDIPWVLFTGDFLFVGDVGRPDLLGEVAKRELAHQHFASVFERLPALPEITEIFPAHGAGSLCGKAISSRRSSTVGYERRFNPALRQQPEQAWVKNLMADMPLAPPYFRRMKRVNQAGPPVIGRDLPGQKRWNAKQVHQSVCENCLVLDVRSKEAFAAAHLPHSISIPAGPNLSTWAGWVLPYDRPILVVCDKPQALPTITRDLLRVGFDDLQGVLEGGLDAWETSGLPWESLSTLSVQQFHQMTLKKGSAPTILDVRTEKEWNARHLEGAIHIHGGALQERLEEVPRDRPVAVVCGSGYRASIAASFLKREGYQNVHNVLGGMAAWKAAEFPMDI